MKINEVINEGIWDDIKTKSQATGQKLARAKAAQPTEFKPGRAMAGALARGFRQGLSDVVAPGAWEKFQTAQRVRKIPLNVPIDFEGKKYIFTGQNWSEFDTRTGKQTPAPANIQYKLDLLSTRVSPPKTTAAAMKTAKQPSNIIIPQYSKPRSTTRYDQEPNLEPMPDVMTSNRPQTSTQSPIFGANGLPINTPSQPVVAPSTKISPQRNPGAPTAQEYANFQEKLRQAMKDQG